MYFEFTTFDSDSRHVVYYQLNFTYRVHIWIRRAENKMVAVSYTHQDVYKRQALNCRVLKTCCVWWRSVKGKG